MKFWTYKKITKEPYDFWLTYGNLCDSLERANKKPIADSLKEIQKYANGLTDGWFDFLNSLDKVIKDNETLLNAEEKDIAADLLFKLKKSLKNR